MPWRVRLCLGTSLQAPLASVASEVSFYEDQLILVLFSCGFILILFLSIFGRPSIEYFTDTYSSLFFFVPSLV